MTNDKQQPKNESSTWIWSGVRERQSQAEQEAYERYAERLLALVHSRMSPALRQRVDPEDVLQSAYYSMFRGIQDGRFRSQRSGSFWRLLAQMTLNKLRRQVERHTADRRAVAVERSLESDSVRQLAALEPAPGDEAAAAEILARCLDSLGEEKRRVLLLRLEDRTLVEIAEELGRSERTIRRWLEEIRKGWGGDES